MGEGGCIDVGVLAGELRDALLQGAKRELQVRGPGGGRGGRRPGRPGLQVGLVGGGWVQDILGSMRHEVLIYIWGGKCRGASILLVNGHTRGSYHKTFCVPYSAHILTNIIMLLLSAACREHGQRVAKVARPGGQQHGAVAVPQTAVH